MGINQIRSKNNFMNKNVNKITKRPIKNSKQFLNKLKNNSSSNFLKKSFLVKEDVLVKRIGYKSNPKIVSYSRKIYVPGMSNLEKVVYFNPEKKFFSVSLLHNKKLFGKMRFSIKSFAGKVGVEANKDVMFPKEYRGKGFFISIISECKSFAKNIGADYISASITNKPSAWKISGFTVSKFKGGEASVGFEFKKK
jgi:hypothetical protein